MATTTVDGHAETTSPFATIPPRHYIAGEPPEVDLLRLALNQVDYGLVVLDADSGRVQFANVPGYAALDDTLDGHGRRHSSSGLCLVDGRVCVARPGHAEVLRCTLARTKSGLRGLLNLGSDPQTSAVAVLPLPHAGQTSTSMLHGSTHAASSYALLLFAKQQMCDDSTLSLFARERGLTSAEGQVLAQVCRGLRPAQIANHHGVQISTVRTQLRSIRMKTCCETIRELVQKVSVLPPMARHLSSGQSLT
jgi:DNA-binding CsgD family transcriptional regulator